MALNDPAQLSPLERYSEALVMFENRSRYVEQSRNTGVASPAPLPPRAAALPIFTNERNTHDH